MDNSKVFNSHERNHGKLKFLNMFMWTKDVGNTDPKVKSFYRSFCCHFDLVSGSMFDYELFGVSEGEVDLNGVFFCFRVYDCFTH